MPKNEFQFLSGRTHDFLNFVTNNYTYFESKVHTFYDKSEFEIKRGKRNRTRSKKKGGAKTAETHPLLYSHPVPTFPSFHDLCLLRFIVSYWKM